MRMLQRLTCCVVAIAVLASTSYAKKKKPSEGPPPTNVIEPKKKKKDEEPPTQILPLPKEPPGAILAEADRLVFSVTPLSAKGLLSQQTRDALRNAIAGAKGATIVKLRAFVAGSGDLRRVQTLISETFADRKLPLPVVSVIQVGAFALEGCQIQIEVTAVDRRAENEHGLAFIAGKLASLADATKPVLNSLASLHIEPPNVRRVTCYISNIEAVSKVQAEVQRAFPNAAATVVQMQRAPIADSAACEGVAALSSPVAKPLDVIDGAGVVGPGKLAFSGVQLAFKNDENDVRIAYSRTEKALEAVGATLKRTAMIHFYPLTRSVGETARKVEPEFCGGQKPSSTLVVLEGLPAQEALLGLDVIAVP
jgi:enamine deaminase RidA (YjgF/YER057c/UK114 family)